MSHEKSCHCIAAGRGFPDGAGVRHADFPACRAFRAAQREKTMTIICIMLDSITTVAICLTLRLSAAAYAWADAARWRRLKLRALDQRRRS